MLKLILSTMLVFAAVSCAHRGNEFQTDTSWLQKNTTRQAEVQYVLGSPFFVGKAQGHETWTYGQYEWRLFGPSYTKELKIYWNPNGTINTYSFISNYPEDKRKLAITNPQDSAVPAH